MAGQSVGMGKAVQPVAEISTDLVEPAVVALARQKQRMDADG